MDQWLKRGVEALGFCTGAYNGYNVLDADSPVAEEWLREHAPATPLMQRTRKGLHRFYRVGTLRVPTVKHLSPTGKVDARGEGGYVVISPSTIAGHRYQWEVGSGAVPNLNVMGAGFFQPGRTSQAGNGGPVGDGDTLGCHHPGSPDLLYDDATGLIIDGREGFMCKVIWGLVADHVRDSGTLPDAEYIAGRAWEIFQDRCDLSDGKYAYADCLAKAIYAVARIGSGERVIDDDSEIGDVAAYEEAL